MSALDRLRATQISPRIAAYSIIALVVVLSVIIVTVRKMSDTSPVYAGKSASKSAKVDVKVDEKGVKDVALARSDDPYAVIVERNLFRPVTGLSSASGPAKPPTPAPTTPKAPLPPMPVAPQGNIDEVKKNIAFTGAVGMPTGQQALLENLQSKETKFAAQGESAFGYRVISISSQLCVLEKNGLQFTLTMGENKTDAPATPKPGGQPGQPGQPGGPEGPKPG